MMMILLPLQERTVLRMWIETIKGTWREALDIRPWDRLGEPRCSFCGRRILDNAECITQNRAQPKRHATFITTCLNHGDYEGQVAMDCFTAQEMTLRKEPRFYHETAVLHEAWFYVKAVFKFIQVFFRELPMGILCSIDLPIRKAIERQKERLGYK